MTLPPLPRHPSRRQTGKALPWGLAAVLLLGSSGAWWAYAQRAPAGDGPAAAASAASGAASGPRPGGRVQPVSVAAVAKRDIQVGVNAIGNIAAANTAVVKPKIEGELRRIHFKEGQWVKAGALLAELDDRALQIALAQAPGPAGA